MYAIIEDSGRQFKVAEGEQIDVDLRDVKPGDAIEFSHVLFCTDGTNVRIGAPYVENAKVVGEVEGEFKAKKVVAYTYQRREQYHRKVGHRQRYLRIRIKQIAVQ